MHYRNAYVVVVLVQCILLGTALLHNDNKRPSSPIIVFLRGKKLVAEAICVCVVLMSVRSQRCVTPVSHNLNRGCRLTAAERLEHAAAAAQLVARAPLTRFANSFRVRAALVICVSRCSVFRNPLSRKETPAVNDRSLGGIINVSRVQLGDSSGKREHV